MLKKLWATLGGIEQKGEKEQANDEQLRKLFDEVTRYNSMVDIVRYIAFISWVQVTNEET